MKPAAIAQEDSGVEAPQILSFSAFDQRIASCLPNDYRPLANKSEKIGILILLVGALTAAISTIYLPSKIAAGFAIAGLAIEISGGLLAIIAGSGKELKEMWNRRPIFAAQLDQESQGFNQIVAWLKAYPENELVEKLQFSRKRLEPLTKRSGFLLGGVERLGFLPVVVALYLQFRDVTLTGLVDVHAGGIFLGLLILVLYFIGLWSISIRWQLETYIRFLEMATNQTSTEAKLP
ncbi:hypothetical protein [Stenotrophobium rhamnosiphilum]|uniref:Uncharacterized protein n=1 Tax=Stenotrophobium rhamnosiphilum TaxID=2029166 RepID=A0A2T5MJ20_9GAMM|nr:hypothetical protein [Stenotrophobium rhamnosiphilum]PTU32565.1 hypothetical protein CJD38_00080 [Stenotrophobium rhamnosiphilum]